MISIVSLTVTPQTANPSDGCPDRPTPSHKMQDRFYSSHRVMIYQCVLRGSATNIQYTASWSSHIEGLHHNKHRTLGMGDYSRAAVEILRQKIYGEHINSECV